MEPQSTKIEIEVLAPEQKVLMDLNQLREDWDRLPSRREADDRIFNQAVTTLQGLVILRAARKNDRRWNLS